MDGCPTDEVLAAYDADAATDAERGGIEAHLAGCPRCRTVVALVTSASVPDAERPRARGSTLGRYLLLEPIGTGAMGEVFEAYDPQLDRRIALKVLRPNVPRERFVREARAMAAISHPNVIAVFEADTDHDQAFLAMELVLGQTLGDWLAGQRRSTSQILGAFAHAARGLAAAHAQGLFHRDFKPANVLVGDDGRIRVCDFGLARFDGMRTESEKPAPTSDHATLHTREGLLLGTPAYMAPEQLAGQRGTAASDQFALCVCLFEALFGHRPYRGATVGELATAMAVPVDVPARRGVSRRVRKALARGLDPDPTRRFPSIEALLPALNPGGWARAGPWLLALVTLGVGFGARGMLGDERSPCPNEGADIPEVWDDTRRSTLTDAMRTLATPLTEDLATQARHTLDSYANDWRASRAEACEATLVRGVQSPRLMDIRIACLDRLASDLDGVLNAAPQLAAREPGRALRALQGLAPVSRCEDARWLEHRELLDPDVEREVQAGRRRLAEARVRINGGQFDEATAAIRHVLDSSASQQHPPLHARARLALGTALWQRGEDPKGAAEALTASVELALANEEWHTAAEAGSKLTCVAARDLAQPDVARAWGRVSVSLSEHTRDDVHVRAHALACVGDLELADGHTAASIELLERAVQLVQDGRHWNLAGYRQMLASAYREAGRLPEAEQQARAAIGDAQTLLGSPYVEAIGHYELAWILLSQDRMEDAMFHIREVVRINDASPNPDALLRSAALGMLHRPLMAMGDHRGAEDSLRESVDGLVLLDPDHPRVAQAKSNLGRFVGQQGRHEEAIALLRDAAEMARRAWPPEHPDRIAIEERLAGALEQAAVTPAEPPAKPAGDAR